MKALIIGFGKMGMLHAATLNSLPEIDEILICETSPLLTSGLKAFGANFRIFSDLNKALETPDLAMAVVATPTSSHMTILQKLISKGLHVFIEKPMAIDYNEAQLALNWIKETGNHDLKIMVGHCLRFAPTFTKIKSLLDQNILGSIDHFEANMYSPDVLKKTKGWRFKRPGSGGGVVLDLGSHLNDMTQYLFGLPTSIKASTTQIVSNHVEDCFTADYYYNGFLGKLNCSWSERTLRKATLSIDIKGQFGNAKILDDWMQIELTESSPLMEAGKYTFSNTQLESSVPFDLAGPMYTHQLVHWIESIQNNTACANGINQNLNNMYLLDIIRASNNQTIHLDWGKVRTEKALI